MAAGTMGTTPPATRTPKLRSSIHCITPVAASNPKALPPLSTMACTARTCPPGLRRSVSFVPGAPPICEYPAVAPCSVRITVVPER